MSGAVAAPEVNGRSVLVTGVGGLVGRSLLSRLAGSGARITTMGRSARREIPGHAIVVDRWRADEIRSATKGLAFDYVFHLAAYGVDPKARDIAEMVEVNVGASLALVETATATRAYVHVGSCSEYAPRTDGQNLRESDPVETGKLYGSTKAAATIASCAIATARDLPFVAARLFDVYGQGEAPHRLLPSLAARLKRGERVPLSPGTQVRDFLAVDDAADGLLALADATGANGGQSIVNLCSGVATSVRLFAETACHAVGASPDLLAFGELAFRPDDLMHQVGDTSGLHQMVTWRPSRSLADGIGFALAQKGGAT